MVSFHLSKSNPLPLLLALILILHTLQSSFKWRQNFYTSDLLVSCQNILGLFGFFSFNNQFCSGSSWENSCYQNMLEKILHVHPCQWLFNRKWLLFKKKKQTHHLYWNYNLMIWFTLVFKCPLCKSCSVLWLTHISAVELLKETEALIPSLCAHSCRATL